MRKNILTLLCDMTGLSAIFRNGRAITKKFCKKEPLSEQIKHAFPESSQAYATAFFDEYFARKNLVDWIFQYRFRDAEDFYRTAIFYLRNPIQTDEPGIWLIAEDSIRYMWQILYDTNSHAVIFDGHKKFEIASSLSDWVKRLADLGINFQTDKSVSRETELLLRNVFTKDDLVTAMKIFPMADQEHYNIDLLASEWLSLNDVDLTIDNYLYRGRFLFELPFEKDFGGCSACWWIIGHGADDEDTGPDEGLILVHRETGKIAWAWQKTQDPLDEYDYFIIADNLEKLIHFFD